MSSRPWLVTGGAGYIGAHLVRLLRDRGDEVVVLDDLSTGHPEAVGEGLVQGDVRDRAVLAALLADTRPRGVFHFAARAIVAESVRAPLDYHDVNVGGTVALAACLLGIAPAPLVFSSSCSVYGDPARLPVDEEAPFAPRSPYGASKAMAERILDDARRQGLPVASLRYFNAAGAHPDGSLGEAHEPETHLVPRVIAAAEGVGPPLPVHGTDLPTRDGTCVRDYVHVVDLAEAHLRTMERLLAGHPGGAWNLGSGVGSTVREVIRAVEEVTGRSVPWHAAPPRPGDPVALHADIRRAGRDLGWQPTRDLATIVEDACRWFRAPRYGSRARRR